jgi:integrase
MGLGPYPLIDVYEARRRRDEARRKLTDGVDPLAHRAAHRARQRASLTFREAARAYIDATETKRRSPKSLRQWKMTLLGETPGGERTKHDYCRSLHDLPIDAIDTAAILRVVAPIWSRVSETASRIRGRIEATIDYAMSTGRAERRPNPAKWRGNLQHALSSRSETSAVQHHDAMPYADVGAFLRRLQSSAGSAPAALALLILTATRTSEVLGARWEEIDFDRRTWTVPAERIKGRVEHIVPLSDAAIELLERARRDFDDGSGFVFPGARLRQPLSNMALAMTMRRMGVGGHTVHGFRSAFRDWAGERGVEFEIAEQCLAHQVGSAVTRAYLRTTMVERRRPVMEAWAAFLAGEASTNVVPLRA